MDPAAKSGQKGSSERQAGKPRPAAAAPPPDPMIGKTVAGFHVKRKLGEGGMGAVYLATQLSLDRDVALKILPERLVQNNPEYVERFQREAKLAASLTHPNIVQVYEAGCENGTWYFAMEFVSGRSLAKVVKEAGPLAESKALAVVLQVAKGLEAAARKNLIHRDIKPENILLTEYGGVKVADFGLAKNLASATRLTQDGSIMGTPAFMSPEQADGQPVDFRADIYSLGVTLYDFLAGRPPYEAETPLSVLFKHLNAPVPDIREANPRVSEGTADVIRTMMAKDPKERFSSYEDLIAALSGKRKEPKKVGARHGVPPQPSAASQNERSGGGSPESGGSGGKAEAGPLESVEDPAERMSVGMFPTMEPEPPTEPTIVLRARRRRTLLIAAILGTAVLVSGAAVAVALILASKGSERRPDEDGPKPEAPAAAPEFELQIEGLLPGAHVSANLIRIAGSASGGELKSVTVNGLEARLDGGRFSLDYAVERDGPLDLEISASGAKGEKAGKKLQLVVDREKPVVTIEEPRGSEALRTSAARIRISGTAKDPFLATVLVDGVAAEFGPDGAFARDVDLPSEGERVIPVKAADRAGNSAETSVRVLVDRTPPSLEWEGFRETVGAEEKAVEVRIRANEAVARVRINGLEAAAAGGAYTSRIELAEGENKVSVEAGDLAGNRGSRQWKVVRKAPDPFDVLKASLAGPLSAWKKADMIRAFLDQHKTGGEAEAARAMLSEIARQALPGKAKGVALGPAEGVYVNEKDGAEMAWVPAGRFEMGMAGAAPEEGPAHEVQLSGFYVYRREVLNRQFAAFLNARGSGKDAEGREMVRDCSQAVARRTPWGLRKSAGKWEPMPGFEEHPVILVSWAGAREYAKWAGGELPSEAQWERAARGTDGRIWPWGNDAGARPARPPVGADGHAVPLPAGDRKGTLAAGSWPEDLSPAGCLDMAGNVAEWCLDGFDAKFYGRKEAGGPDPVCGSGGGGVSPSLAVVRGGSWFDPPERGRVCAREGEDPAVLTPRIGFRCVMK